MKGMNPIHLRNPWYIWLAS